MDHRNGTIVPFAVFASRQGGDQLVDHIIHIDKVHHHLRIIHLDRQVVRDIVTESRHCTVIVRTAPFPEHVRKTIDQDLRPSLSGILEQEVLSCPLRLAIRIVQRRLRRRRDHHRTGIAVFLQRIQQEGSETEISLHKLRLVFRTVHPGQVKDKIGILAIDVQFGRVAVRIIFEDFQFSP